MNRATTTIIFLFFLLFAGINTCPVESSATVKNINSVDDYEKIISEMNMTRIESNLAFLSGLESRATGYPGYEKAAEYLYSEFSRYLENVSFHYYPVTVPIVQRASIKVLETGEEIRLFPFLPNQVALGNTPEEGITGSLVYVGDGSKENLRGKKIEGNIILMELESSNRWFDVVNFGAKAVIFAEPRFPISRAEFNAKVLEVGLDFPRLYVSAQDGEYLRGLVEKGEVRVSLKSQVRFKTVKAKNVMGFLRGTTYLDRYVILSAQYDSYSYVPSLAPGTTEAVSVAALLELARFFHDNPPKYTLLFIAFSGTDQMLEGSRWFINDFIREQWDGFGQKILWQWDLGITGETPHLMPMVLGGVYREHAEAVADWVPPFKKYLFETLKPRLESRLNIKWDLIDVEKFAFDQTIGSQAGAGLGFDWPNPMLRPTNNEPLTMLGGPGANLVTSRSHQLYWLTPFDTIDKIDFGNMEHALKIVLSIMYDWVNLDELQKWMIRWKPTYGKEMGPKWVDATGRVAMYNETLGWYSPLPEQYQIIVAYRADAGWKGGWGFPREEGMWAYTNASKDGSFKFLCAAQEFRLPAWLIMAYGLDPETGKIIYAPDTGTYMYKGPIDVYQGIATRAYMKWHPFDIGIYTVFKAGSMALFDVEHPQWSHVPIAFPTLPILDFRAHSPVTYRSVAGQADKATGRSVFLVYIQPKVPVEIMLRITGVSLYPLWTLTNASQGSPMGVGYSVPKEGEQIVLGPTHLLAARDLYLLNEERIKLLPKRGMIVPFMEDHRRAGTFVADAFKSLQNQEYDAAFAYAAAAIAIQSRIYESTKRTIEDAINNVPFFAVILLPFAFLIEHMAPPRTGSKRIATLLACYILPVAFLWYFHPGFFLASDISLVLVGFGVLVLIIVVLAVLFGYFQGYTTELRRRVVGLHFAEISRGSAAILAFSTAVKNIAKHKLRAILTVISLVLIIGGLISFCALTVTPTWTVQKSPGTAPYNGFVVHHFEYGRSAWLWLGYKVPDELQLEYGDKAIVSPRAWWHTKLEIYGQYVASESGQEAVFYAILGLSPQEKDVTRLPTLALKEGRDFLPTDNDVCILGDRLAKELNATVGSKIYLSSVELSVVGIVNSTIYDSYRDIDGNPLTPIDRREAEVYNIYYRVNDIIIMPFKSVMSLGGVIANVAVALKDPELLQQATRDVYFRFATEIWTGINGKVYIASMKGFLQFYGFESQIIPTILAALIILNLMLASVEERKAEIATLASLGLSPLHEASMFFAESITYAIIGAVIGYVFGVFFSTTFVSMMGWQISLNYSTSWILDVMFVAIGMTLASSAWPAYIASKMVTPSLERRWRMPKPRGDEWDIPLPFTTEAVEVNGVLAYIHEYLKAHGMERSEIFNARNIAYSEEKESKILMSDVALEPYELGVDQNVQLIATLKENRYYFELLIRRAKGVRSTWERQNRRFVDAVRMQLLLWRSLGEEDRKTYISKFDQSLTI